MNEIKMNIPFPLDDDKFFRRACPFCKREFKIQISDEELEDLIQKSKESYMLERGEGNSEENEYIKENDSEKFFCPYCGQEALSGEWWTIEQAKYIQMYVENIMADIINKNFIENIERKFRGNKFVKFEGKKLKIKEPRISPDNDDMIIINLPCCQSKIKIEENWNKIVHCFYCGFPYESKNI
jgi:hypothetical protein